MSRILATLMIATLSLSACSGMQDSRLNPFNWFGNAREAPAPQTQETNPLIPGERRGLLGLRQAREAANAYRGQPVDAVSELVIERVPGGAIIRASGLSQFQNTYDVRLIPANADELPTDGVLDYQLEAIIPERPIAGGSERQRMIIAARAVTDKQLEGVRAIRVAGVQNARVVNRR